MPVGWAHGMLLGIVALSIGLMLVRPRGIAEVWWVGGGAVLLLVLRLIPLRLAGRAVAAGSDVYLFLTGMMLLSELAREQGVFDWVAATAVGRARGSCARLFLLVYATGTVVTVLMSNDATAVVLTPAILTAVRKAKVEPLPYLFVCALIANAASFVRPISNPANLVVFHGGLPPLGQWMAAFGVPSVLSILVTFGVVRFVFRRELCERIECDVEQVRLERGGRLVVAGLAVMVGVLLAASVVITAVVSAVTRSAPWKLARQISWATLLLVAGLFVMVDAVESVGALHVTGQWLQWAERQTPAVGAMVVGFAVGVANNLVNNLPLGLMAGATVQAQHVKGLLANAVMIGVDLGPNLSVTGSLATILWLLALRKEKLQVSFWRFLQVGMVAMPVALLGALAGAIGMHALGVQ
jgi:arsenical pump membrane protein